MTGSRQRAVFVGTRRRSPARRSPQERGDAKGPNPTDRGKRGTKHHLVTDAEGTPLNSSISGANRNDSGVLEATLDAALGASGGKRYKPRPRLGMFHADKACAGLPIRRAFRRCSIKLRIACKGVGDSIRPGRHRWVVERTFARMASFRRLIIRYKRGADIHLAFDTFATALICREQIRRLC